MERNQELINAIRSELNLSNGEFSDDVVFEKTKNSLLATIILLRLAVTQLKKEIKLCLHLM